ncbi:MAG: glucosidase, partial [Candidatus Eremiobacteraeota bacterium]|nr:glucosidase [Candidatus Eremiobacteraeota bacterium]
VVRWRRWGTYLSQRQWGTVREDYSPDGDAWGFFPFDDAHARAYRWGEDGLLGLSDDRQQLCFALALWNGVDECLKERLFGLSNPQGNHGEDVKECYYYLDNTPTHSYAKALYKYPQMPFPYRQLVSVNAARTRLEPEFELVDTGVFDGDKYFDVTIEYAKASAEDICIQIEACNRGPETATLHVLPTLWFRNTWSWDGDVRRPAIAWAGDSPTHAMLAASHTKLGDRTFYVQPANAVLFTENDTNRQHVFGEANPQPYVKDAFDRYLIHGETAAVNPARFGTKAAPVYALAIERGRTARVRVRLADSATLPDPLGASFDAALAQRRREADEFYARVSPYPLSDSSRQVQRQAFAGLLWTKQYYNYLVYRWLEGDSNLPSPSPNRKRGRNHGWKNLEADNIWSMPDDWEYPWFAAWDTAFHCVTLALIDPVFAKNQLDLLTREWYMRPDGKIPAYEWNFSDTNPPVFAWAAHRVYQIERKVYGRADRQFLERVFQKLLLNFTWWCNRADVDGLNVFQGGFLGLDNIGVFDRSTRFPDGSRIDQADGTTWMASYCLAMLGIAVELAQQNPVYEDIATKFFEHFVYIADAINGTSDEVEGLWDEQTGFYYDSMHPIGRPTVPLRIRSIVGVLPLIATVTADEADFQSLPEFSKRVRWFFRNRPDLHANAANLGAKSLRGRRLLALVNEERLRRVLAKVLDESEFLSPHGIRSLSKYHAEHPFELRLDVGTRMVDYEPAESTTDLFGGNSNWRGPVWFPPNYLIIEALQRYHYYFGDDFMVECPTGSGKFMNLWDVATELSHRLIDLFVPGTDGRRPMLGAVEKFQSDPHFAGLLPFYEYFHGDTGAGLGAMHQTGWTGLVAKLLQQCAEYCGQEKNPV